MSKTKTENYNELAGKIYTLINSEDPCWGDAVASLELVRLWIYTDYQDMHNENKAKPDVIEIEDKNGTTKIPNRKFERLNR